ncbi:MAG: hypothetical protein ACRD2L_06970 [Terriglobia bacterium]
MKVKPDAVFVLHVPRSHKLMVYIWPTLKAMRTRIKTLEGAARNQSHTFGFFHAPRTKIIKGRSVVVKRRVVGQIHLVKGRFGAGVFAHELQHFLSWWSWVKEYDLIGKDWERVSYLAGNLTTKFWQLFYKRDEVKVDGRSN